MDHPRKMYQKYNTQNIFLQCFGDMKQAFADNWRVQKYKKGERRICVYNDAFRRLVCWRITHILKLKFQPFSNVGGIKQALLPRIFKQFFRQSGWWRNIQQAPIYTTARRNAILEITLNTWQDNFFQTSCPELNYWTVCLNNNIIVDIFTIRLWYQAIFLDKRHN